MGFPVEPPFPIYTDRNGDPLESGYVYFGVANQNPQTNPISIYWDEAGTIPASQPLRTAGGFVVRNGTPANVFVTADYSVVVRDHNGVLVYSSPTSVSALALLVSDDGASRVGYIADESDAVATTVQTALRRELWVDDFIPLNVNPATTDVSEYVQNALDAVNTGGVLNFGKYKTYRLDSVITLISTDTTADRIRINRTLNFNGCILDFSNLVSTADYLAEEQTNLFNIGTAVNTGTPSNPQALIEEGRLVLNGPCVLVGPEPTPPYTAPDANVPQTGTVGWRLQLALNVTWSDLIATNCVVGFETKDSWQIQSNNLLARNSWCGFSVMGGSTTNTWLECGAVQCCYYSIIRSTTRSSSPTYGAFAAVDSQVFINPRIENVWYFLVVFPHDTDIKGLTVKGGRAEDVARDFINSGFVFSQADFADPGSTLSSAATPSVFGWDVTEIGKVQWGGSGAGFYSFKGPTASIRNTLSRPFLKSLLADVSCAFSSSHATWLGEEGGNAGEEIWTNSNGDTSFRIDMEDGGCQVGNMANADPIVLDYYLEDDFTVTFTGVDAVVTGSGYATRIGNTVTLDLPTLSGTSNATTKTYTGLPAAFIPTTEKSGLTITTDNGGTAAAARFNITSGGVVEFFVNAAGGAFTASGAATIGRTSVSYTVN